MTSPNPCPACGAATLTSARGIGKLICEDCAYLLDAASLEEAIAIHNSIKPRCPWIMRRFLGFLGAEYTRGCDGKTSVRKETYCPGCGGEIEISETKIG